MESMTPTGAISRGSTTRGRRLPGGVGALLCVATARRYLTGERAVEGLEALSIQVQQEGYRIEQQDAASGVAHIGAAR